MTTFPNRVSRKALPGFCINGLDNNATLKIKLFLGSKERRGGQSAGGGHGTVIPL